MGKKIVFVGLSLGLLISSVSADALKNSLTSIMNTKEEPTMVDLGNINLNKKPKVKKNRSAKSVLATINGHKILKKSADTYLSQRTQGKITDFDTLPKDQRARLIQELSLPILAMDAAKKELSDKEKEAVFTRTWMQKEARTIKVSDDDALGVYNQLKKEAEDTNVTDPIPPFETIKDRLKLQIVEKMIVGKLMKDVEIKVY
ncbi:hypothetical protein [Sulfurovum sp.]|uniref:hypothetical protein n=1 Tax=Sulfurovum sp. TaxID=1969726 RepID=UPI0028680090|nr:hypothetical protein [Sulfurovum sp.]